MTDAETERAAIVAYINRMLSTPDSNSDHALDQPLCCSGIDCGCRGSTVGEYLAYQLTSAIERGEHTKDHP